MALGIMLQYISDFQYYMDKYGDPRTNPWFLMSSPFPTLLICLSYVYLVKVLGPRFMENRKPYELKNVLILYNFLQVVFSAWLFYESMMGGWLNHYSFRCQPVDYTENPKAIRMVHACWWYYFSKFTEFFDTVSFNVFPKHKSRIMLLQYIGTLHIIIM
ncbi:elongation of very long chain fatty acids protein AAEL008004-like isoform X2 [Spodoptera litura]|uniref:Elongation of very long chain fatty acids protein n=1 Tax=Spodoptera litura TaxID=69820 RepID=A0A9J7J3N8_SPOLT|nr:elongation of very long chain fatty acids protein AAEL008004-like isoform X2 [Spodoptera litura]